MNSKGKTYHKGRDMMSAIGYVRAKKRTGSEAG